MKSYQRGLNLIELIVVITITAILAVPMIKVLRSMLDTWKKGSNQLETIKSSHLYLDPIVEKLRYAEEITFVSLINNTEGYIQFTDLNQQDYTIFYNSRNNQTFFNATNTFAENSLIFLLNSPPLTPELLLQNVDSFAIETYAEDSSLFFRVVSANNTAEPDYDSIISLKIVASVTIDSFTESLEQLIELPKTPFESSSSLTIGNELTPFSSMIESSSETTIQDNDSSFDGDYLSLPSLTKFVKILHTSRYFDTISEAITVAQPGDTILIGHKEGGYTENIIVPENITLRGGYNPVTWERDLEQYPSVLYIKEGLTLVDSISAIIALSNNSVIDGLVLDAKDLAYAIYASNATNITIMNTQIDNVETALNLNNISGKILQNQITANITSMSVIGSSQTEILRNRVSSLGEDSIPNITIENASNLTFHNNLISNGYIGLSLDSIATSSIDNNIITKASFFGVMLQNLNGSSLNNNAIIENNLGLFFNNSAGGNFTSADLNNNLFAKNEFGNANNIVLNNTNLLAYPSDYEWENQLGPNYNFFTNLNSYELQSTSPLIDRGLGSNEVYLNTNPSRGTAVNDIGIFGGVYSGRVGIAKKTAFTTALSSAAIQALLTQSYPGDILFFGSGTHDVNQPISLKPYQYLGGVLPDLTILNHSGASYLVTLSNSNIVEQLSFLGNSKPVMLVDSVENTLLSQLIFNGASTAITLANTDAELKFSNFYQCTTAIKLGTNYTGSINYNIFEATNLAIDNTGNPVVGTSYNHFFNNNTLYSGNVIDYFNQENTASAFRAPNSNRFELRPTANAVNTYLNYDAGAVEYFHHFGNYLSIPITSTLDRYYKTLEINYANLENTYKVLSGITIAFVKGENIITLNNEILIDDESLNSVQIDLPPSLISDDMQLNIQLDSFTFGRSPYIDDITLSW